MAVTQAEAETKVVQARRQAQIEVSGGGEGGGQGGGGQRAAVMQAKVVQAQRQAQIEVSGVNDGGLKRDQGRCVEGEEWTQNGQRLAEEWLKSDVLHADPCRCRGQR